MVLLLYHGHTKKIPCEAAFILFYSESFIHVIFFTFDVLIYADYADFSMTLQRNRSDEDSSKENNQRYQPGPEEGVFLMFTEVNTGKADE